MQVGIELTVIAPVSRNQRSRDTAVEVHRVSLNPLLIIKFGVPTSLVDSFGYLHQELECCFEH